MKENQMVNKRYRIIKTIACCLCLTMVPYSEISPFSFIKSYII